VLVVVTGTVDWTWDVTVWTSVVRLVAFTVSVAVAVEVKA
jgi:hypothetical protein